MERTNLGVEEILQPTTNVATGQPFFKAEEANEAPDDTVEASAAKPESFQVGRERMKAVGGFFARQAEKVREMKARAGASLSKFWSRTKNAVGTGTAAVLMAPEAAEYAANKVEQFDDWTKEGLTRAGKSAGYAMAEGYDTAKKNLGEAKDALANWGAQKIDMTKNLAKATHSSNVEDFKMAGQEISKGYKKVIEFGGMTIEAGKNKIAQIKESLRIVRNEVYLKNLDLKIRMAAQMEADHAEKRAEQQKIEAYYRQKQEGLQKKKAALLNVDELEMLFV